MLAPVPHRRVEVNETDSRRIVRGFCAFADMEMPEGEVFAEDEVVHLLRACGFAVTLNTLREFVAKNYIGEPDGGKWTPLYVHTLACALDVRHRWLPAPNQLHDPRKSGARLRIEIAQADGLEPFDGLDDHTLEDLLIYLSATDQREMRSALFECVKEKMHRLGFVEE